MKRFYSFLLLTIILLPTAVKIGYMAYWKLEQTEITARYCENKDKPEMECNGRCHLEKQLEKIDENSEPNSKNQSLPCLKKWGEESYFLTIFCFNILAECDAVVSHISLFCYQQQYSFIYVTACFHPPRG